MAFLPKSACGLAAKGLFARFLFLLAVCLGASMLLSGLASCGVPAVEAPASSREDVPGLALMRDEGGMAAAEGRTGQVASESEDKPGSGKPEGSADFGKPEGRADSGELEGGPSSVGSEEMAISDEPMQSVVALVDDPANLPAETVLSHDQLDQIGVDALFSVQPIPDSVFARMDGVTFPADCPVSRDDLRYIRLLHVDAEGQVKVGEMVANAQIAEDLCGIFRQLFDAGYAIERVRLACDYGGDDEESMRDNNTSCFNCRPIEGSGAQSRHSFGMAVDINPLYNPYVSQSLGVLPTTAGEYTDRSVVTPYTIDTADLCCQTFALHGYTWGGDWQEPVDYQHFEKG